MTDIPLPICMSESQLISSTTDWDAGCCFHLCVSIALTALVKLCFSSHLKHNPLAAYVSFFRCHHKTPQAQDTSCFSLQKEKGFHVTSDFCSDTRKAMLPCARNWAEAAGNPLGLWAEPASMLQVSLGSFCCHPVISSWHCWLCCAFQLSLTETGFSPMTDIPQD